MRNAYLPYTNNCKYLLNLLLSLKGSFITGGTAIAWRMFALPNAPQFVTCQREIGLWSREKVVQWPNFTPKKSNVALVVSCELRVLLVPITIIMRIEEATKTIMLIMSDREMNNWSARVGQWVRNYSKLDLWKRLCHS